MRTSLARCASRLAFFLFFIEAFAAWTQPPTTLTVYAGRGEIYPHAWIVLSTRAGQLGLKETGWGFQPKGNPPPLPEVFNVLSSIPGGDVLLQLVEYIQPGVQYQSGEIVRELEAKSGANFSLVGVSISRDLSSSELAVVNATLDSWQQRIEAGTLQYQGFGENCVTFVAAVAKAAGLRTPPWSSLTPPEAYVRGLRLFNSDPRSILRAPGGAGDLERTSRGASVDLDRVGRSWYQSKQAATDLLRQEATAREDRRRQVLQSTFLDNWKHSQQAWAEYREWVQSIREFQSRVSAPIMTFDYEPTWEGGFFTVGYK